MHYRQYIKIFLIGFLIIIVSLFYQKLNYKHRPKSLPTKPQPIRLPVSLKRLGISIEGSGLTWFSKEKKFFLVSDDLPHFKNRVFPYIYSLTPNGLISYPPVRVISKDPFDDLEGIASDGENFYLLCSQSMSSKGQLPIKRTCFLKAELKRQKLYVKKNIYLRTRLHELFKNLSPQKRKEVFGFDSEKKFQKLNIEGLAYYKGDLYLAISAPTIKEYALIWRLKDIEQFFTQPELEGKLQLWHRVDTNGEGLSGITFLSDGSLVLLTGTKKGGALWFVPEKKLSNFDLDPVKVTSWPYNPEGVSPWPISVDNKVVVVFDRGKRTPLWTVVDVKSP